MFQPCYTPAFAARRSRTPWAPTCLPSGRRELLAGAGTQGQGRKSTGTSVSGSPTTRRARPPSN